MQQRVSLITLGVSDLQRARNFYAALGWQIGPQQDAAVVFIQAGALAIGLWDRAALAADCGLSDGGGFGGIALAQNLGSPAEVDAVIEQARAAGAVVKREAAKTFWGGYSGVFTDPDGHPWEIAHNPFWTINADGSISL